MGSECIRNILYYYDILVLFVSSSKSLFDVFGYDFKVKFFCVMLYGFLILFSYTGIDIK